MSKAILVLDMPSKCEECCFCRGFNVCRIKQCIEREGITSVHTVDKQIMEGTKPSWCPLREVPQQREEKMASDVGLRDCGFIDGWNACLDEILEGKV